MSNWRRATPPRRAGRHWLAAAVAALASVALFWVAVERDQASRGCLAGQGSPTVCEAAHSWATLATLAALGSWAVALTLTATGAVVGIVDGRSRRRFAAGRWVSVGVVGLCAPWALLAYAGCYAMARLLSAPRRDPAACAREGGWQEALRLYAALAAGQHPQAVYAPDLPAGDTFYMDVPFGYSRSYRMNVTYEPGGMVAVGSAGLVAGAAIGRLIGTSIGYARAASLSRRRWRAHRPTRVMVTATATWCTAGGRWLRFDHDAVIDYRVTAEPACILTFAGAAPLRLHGSSAWCHAVLFAYFRHGAGPWWAAPFLDPLRHVGRAAAHVPR